MANPVIQVKRGTTAQVDAVTPAIGEPLLDTTLKDLRIGDGSTAGGVGVSKGFAKAFAKLDLSGAAQADVVILHSSRVLRITKLLLLYTEASSADAGVTVTVGKETSSTYYYTGESETDKAQWYELDATLLATDLAAGDSIICETAGGKVGIGEILVCIEYVLD